MRDPPDNIEEYKTLYGSLGPYLQVLLNLLKSPELSPHIKMGVVRSRQQSGSKPAAPPAPSPAPVATSARPPMVGGPGQVTHRFHLAD